jgi:trans-aconitate methyltransferase
MTRRTASIPPTWFEQLYAGDADPWRFATSDYERDKYAATLAALPDRSFAAGLEVGCSFGVLTRQLSPRCDSLLAIDVAESVLDRARQACPGVVFERRFVPDEWPPGRFDLILFSEVLYYLTEADIIRTAKLATGSLLPNGVILLVHFLGETDYPTTGDQAAELFIRESGLSPGLRRSETGYRIDRLDAAAPDATSPG